MNFSDAILAEQQHDIRQRNHEPSAKSQAVKKSPAFKAHIAIGDLIFLKSDGDKHTARDKYMVTDLEDDKVFAKKLVGFQFRSKVFVLKLSEVYKVPSAPPVSDLGLHHPMVKSNPYHSDPSDDDQTDTDDHDSVDTNVHPTQRQRFNVPVANYPILQPLSLPLEDTITTSPEVPNTTYSSPQVPTHYNTPQVPSKPDPVLTNYPNPPVPASDSPGQRRSSRATTQPKWLNDYVPK